MAEAAKTSVWWDIDRCAVPAGSANHVAHNVVAALAAAGYRGPVSISAYGDTSWIAPAVLADLSSTGVSLHHVPAGAKDGIDKKMLVDMLFWALDNPPPGNYLLISAGDQGFSDVLHRLKMKRYGILLAQPSNASSQLVAAAANTVWLWETLVAAPDQSYTHTPQYCNRKSNYSDVLKLKRRRRKRRAMSNKGTTDSNQHELKNLQSAQESDKPSTSTQCVPRNATLDFGVVKADSTGRKLAGKPRKLKPLQKYVNKTKLHYSEDNTGDNSVLRNPADFGVIKADSTERKTARKPRKLKALQKYVNKTKLHYCEDNTGDNSVLRNPADFGVIKTDSTVRKPARKPRKLKPPQKYVNKTKLHYSEDNTGDNSVLRNPADFGVIKADSTVRKQAGKPRKLKPLQKYINKTKLRYSEDNTDDNSTAKPLKPLEKYYIKKTSIASSSGSNQLDSVAVPRSSMGSTTSGLNRFSVLSSSSSESLEGAKVDHSSLLGVSTHLSQLSAQKPVVSTHSHPVIRVPHELVLGNNKCSTSTEHASRDGIHDFGVSIGHNHSTYQQPQSSQEQYTLHSNYNMGDNNGKARNQHEMTKQNQEYVWKTNIISSSTNDEIDFVNGFPGNSRGSISSHPSKSISTPSSSEPLEVEGTKAVDGLRCLGGVLMLATGLSAALALWQRR